MRGDRPAGGSGVVAPAVRAQEQIRAEIDRRVDLGRRRRRGRQNAAGTADGAEQHGLELTRGAGRIGRVQRSARIKVLKAPSDQADGLRDRLAAAAAADQSWRTVSRANTAARNGKQK